MGSLQNPVDDVEVPGGEPADHVRHQVGPLLREVLLADDGDGLAQLLLDRPRRFEHEIDDKRLDRLSVGSVNLVSAFLRDRPIPFHVVFESNGSRNLLEEEILLTLSVQKIIWVNKIPFTIVFVTLNLNEYPKIIYWYDVDYIKYEILP